MGDIETRLNDLIVNAKIPPGQTAREFHSAAQRVSLSAAAIIERAASYLADKVVAEAAGDRATVDLGYQLGGIEHLIAVQALMQQFMTDRLLGQIDEADDTYQGVSRNAAKHLRLVADAEQRFLSTLTESEN